MRDPERIDRILGLLRKEWKKFPDWRLGQLLENISASDDWESADLFFYEDDRLEAALLIMTNEHEGRQTNADARRQVRH